MAKNWKIIVRKKGGIMYNIINVVFVNSDYTTYFSVCT